MELKVLMDRRSELQGNVLTDADAKLLSDICPAWLLDVWRQFPLTGVRMHLSDAEDATGIGVSLQWMSATEMLSEANDASPGREARREGFVPIGKCLEGSGDPYFIAMTGDDPALVRIPHTAARGGALNRSAVETVSPSLTQFFRIAKVR
jgi:hypothetical protein